MTPGAPYDPALNSFASYKLAVAALRENAVRSGAFPPLTDLERRQAQEGVRPWSSLDCVRGGS